MNAQHSLFPWRLLEGVVFDANGKQVHAVYPCDDHGHRINSDEVDEANARLIAAAPELLEAIRDLLVIANSRGTSLGLDEGGPVLDKARAAIAKAEGRT